MVATTFYGTYFIIDLLWFNRKRDLFILFWWKKVKMVSQSRLYFALLASVASMAFWMGMWSSTVSQNSNFTNPKPYRVILYYSGAENSSQISSGGKKKLFCFLCAQFIRWLHEFLVPQSPIHPWFLDQSEFLFVLTKYNNKQANKACTDWPKSLRYFGIRIWEFVEPCDEQLILYQYFVFTLI